MTTWTDADGGDLVNIPGTRFGKWCQRHIFTVKDGPESVGTKTLLAEERRQHAITSRVLQGEQAAVERLNEMLANANARITKLEQDLNDADEHVTGIVKRINASTLGQGDKVKLIGFKSEAVAG